MSLAYNTPGINLISGRNKKDGETRTRMLNTGHCPIWSQSSLFPLLMSIHALQAVSIWVHKELHADDPDSWALFSSNMMQVPKGG